MTYAVALLLLVARMLDREERMTVLREAIDARPRGPQPHGSP